MSVHIQKQGDIDPDLILTLTDRNGDPVPSLDTADSITLLMKRPDGSLQVSGGMTVEDVAAAKVKYAWKQEDVDDALGLYMGEVEVKWPDGETTTYPNDSEIHIRFRKGAN